MLRRGLVSFLVIALIVAGLLGLGGYAGWSQGYAAGLVTGAGGAVPAYVPFAHGFSPVFFGIGFIFKFLFLILFFFIIIRMFKFFTWRMAGGPQGGPPWGRHGHGEGRHGPWGRKGRGGSSEESSETIDPDLRSDDVTKV